MDQERDQTEFMYKIHQSNPFSEQFEVISLDLFVVTVKKSNKQSTALVSSAPWGSKKSNLLVFRKLNFYTVIQFFWYLFPEDKILECVPLKMGYHAQFWTLTSQKISTTCIGYHRKRFWNMRRELTGKLLYVFPKISNDIKLLVCICVSDTKGIYKI